MKVVSSDIQKFYVTISCHVSESTNVSLVYLVHITPCHEDDDDNDFVYNDNYIVDNSDDDDDIDIVDNDVCDVNPYAAGG